LKFADGSVQSHRESAFAAHEILPLQFDPEAMPFLSYLEHIGRESDDVLAPVERQCSFQGLVERRHLRAVA